MRHRPTPSPTGDAPPAGAQCPARTALAPRTRPRWWGAVGPAVALAIATSGCGPAEVAPRTVPRFALGPVSDRAVSEQEATIAAGGPPAPGPRSEPVVLGPPALVAEGLVDVQCIAVPPGSRYYAVTTHRGTVHVDAHTGAAGHVVAAEPDACDAEPAAATDDNGRTYHADAAHGQVRVTEPSAPALAGAYLVLAGLAGPAALAVDTARDRLLVVEREAGRVSVYELP